MAISGKYWVLMYDDRDFKYWYANSWQTDWFIVALIVGYINWFNYTRIEIRCNKWHWIVKG